MLSRYEKRNFTESETIWIALYKNLHNMPHWHIENELILCLTGQAKVMVNDSIYAVPQDYCVFCDSGDVHYVNSNSDCVLLVCQFKEELFHKVARNIELCVPVFKDRFGIKHVLEEISDELHNKESYYAQKANSQLINLMIDIFRQEKSKPKSESNTISYNRYRDLLGWLDREFPNISFQEAAAFLNLSESHFSRFFNKMSGMSFSQFSNAMRIEKAITLLRSRPEIKTTQVMIECGFNTIRNFNRVFKQFTGFTPKSLPADFSFTFPNFPSTGKPFDPTLENSILLS